MEVCCVLPRVLPGGACQQIVGKWVTESVLLLPVIQPILQPIQCPVAQPQAVQWTLSAWKSWWGVLLDSLAYQAAWRDCLHLPVVVVVNVLGSGTAGHCSGPLQTWWHIADHSGQPHGCLATPSAALFPQRLVWLGTQLNCMWRSHATSHWGWVRISVMRRTLSLGCDYCSA